MNNTTSSTTHRITTTELGYKVGDIIYWQIGCTMELPQFARITRLTACSATAEMLQDTITESDANRFYGKKMPLVNQPTGKIVKLRVHQNGRLCTMGDCSEPVSQWDGKPKSFNELD